MKRGSALERTGHLVKYATAVCPHIEISRALPLLDQSPLHIRIHEFKEEHHGFDLHMEINQNGVPDPSLLTFSFIQ